LVTGLATVDGNSQVANGENIERRTRLNPYGSDGNYTKLHAYKTISALHQLERDHAKTSRILRTHHLRSIDYWGEVRKACWPVKTFHRKLFYLLPL
jgi:hypothetical protein